MHALRTLASLIATVLLIVTSLVLVPVTASAQECEPWEIDCGGEPGDPNPPTVTILPSTTSHFGLTDVLSLQITIQWCDDNSLAAGSRFITLNSVDVTDSFTHSSGSQSGCGVLETSVGTIFMEPGVNYTISATIEDLHNNVGSANSTYTYTRRGVALSPDAGESTVPISAAAQQDFVIRNAGTATVTFDLTKSCTGTVPSGCTLSSSSVQLAAGASTTIGVTYTPTSAGDGQIRVTATQSGASTVADSGWADLIVAPVPAQVAVAEINPGATIERDLCLTIAAGPSAAYECGDLRLDHALPSVRTFGKTRTPVLIYSSQHAQPHPLIAVSFTVPALASAPDSVTALLKVNGVNRDTARFGNVFTPGVTRRVVMGYEAGPNDTTGYYTYVVEFTRWNGAIATPFEAAGELAIVNRSNSPFGAGWWLAGLEKLQAIGQDDIFWIGGDGSTRYYTRVPGQNTWHAPGVDRADSMTYANGIYTRYLPHGAKAKFDTLFRHVETVDRLGNATRFSYDAQGRLGQIVVPPEVVVSMNPLTLGIFHSYDFAYSTNLVTVTANSPGLARRDSIKLSSGRVTRLTDPDTTFVDFTYHGSTKRVATRADRRGHVTAFAFDDAGKLVRSSIALAAGDSIVNVFRSVESLGFAANGLPTPVDPAVAYTRLDGPRSAPVHDTTAFWLDGFGAPRKIANALGEITKLSRRDTRWPAQVTRLERANGAVTLAEYDTLGRLSKTIATNPLDDNRHAVTRYEWNRYDFVTRIVQPELDSLVLEYDANTGNRIWQQDARGSSSRVNFRYYTSGRIAGLLRAVELPGGIKDSVVYDSLGNLATTTSARYDAATRYDNDLLGRVTRVRSPIDSLGTGDPQTDSLHYDLMDRVVRKVSIGPAMNGVSEQRLVVLTGYNQEGQVDTVRRFAEPDAADIDTIRTAWTYDAAGRALTEKAPDGNVESRQYDRAGNVTQVTTRRGHVFSMEYDALNRLTKRVVPAETFAKRHEGIPVWRTGFQNHVGNTDYPRYPTDSTDALRRYIIAKDSALFGYDAIGNLILADNSDAQVRRSYYPGGLLRDDTLRIRTVPAGGNFTTHQYALRYRYDLNGRRVALRHPTQLLPGLAGMRRLETEYTYDAQIGGLKSVTDLLGFEFRYHYNLRNEVDSLYYPANIRQGFGYDAAGNPTAFKLFGTSGNLQRDIVRRHDGRGKLLRSDDPVGTQEVKILSYSGLGHIRTVDLSEKVFDDNGSLGSTRDSDESFTFDALGNNVSNGRQSTDQYSDDDLARSNPTGSLFTFKRYTGQLVKEGQQAGGGSQTDTTHYDAAGNVVFLNQLANTGRLRNRVSYHGADNLLRAVDFRDSPTNTELRMAFDEYRYDALGRRVLVRSRRECSGFQAAVISECSLGLIRRTVWDGSEELWEIQMPGDSGSAHLENDTAVVAMANLPGSFDPNPMFGRVVYTNGLAMDQPLGITRINYEDDPPTLPHLRWKAFMIVPLWNPKGAADLGYYAHGPLANCLSSPTRCVELDWKYGRMAFGQTGIVRSAWHGTLLQDKSERTGLVFRRNRYYEPQTGRFTQEDPIGLAGGINLYGFAAGDAVNFADPFGLAPCPPDNDCWGASQSMAVFGQLGRMAPAMEDAIVGFLPTTASIGMTAPVGAGSVVGAPAARIATVLRTGAGSGILTSAGVAQRVAAATGGTVRELARSEGFRVTVMAGSRNIVARIKSTGEMRVGIDRIGALTREGLVSADRALTHLRDLSSRDLIDLVNKARQLVGAPK